MEGSRLAVVILNLNGCDVLRDCLKSLEESSHRDFHVLVVDNGSTDDSVRMVRKEFPLVRVIETGRNIGFAAGNNIGIRREMEEGVDHVLLLNNDTIVDRDCLGHLVAAMDNMPDAGAATPLILFAEPPDHIWSAGGSYSLWRGIARHDGLRSRRNDPRFARPRDVTFATGCALMISRVAIEKTGMLDETLFAYNEDADLSCRILRNNLRIRYVPEAVLWHLEGWSSRRTVGQAFRLHLCTRNILAVHAKHRRWYHALTFFPFFTFRWLLLAGGNALMRGNMDTLRGIASGIRAHIRGEQGKPGGR